jgi:hypothetical protein
LKHGGIKLIDMDDEIIWSKNKALRRYTTKLGYEVSMAKEDEAIKE